MYLYCMYLYRMYVSIYTVCIYTVYCMYYKYLKSNISKTVRDKEKVSMEVS